MVEYPTVRYREPEIRAVRLKSFSSLGAEMPGYYAVYRVLETDIEFGVRFRAEFYDERPENNKTDKHFMSFARDLGILSTSQLESLKREVHQICKIPVLSSEDWGNDRKKHGTIFLIEDTVFENIGKNCGAAIKVDLKKCWSGIPM